MNKDKIIVEIICVAIDQSFDCIVPRNITGKMLCSNFLNLIHEHVGIDFGNYDDAVLFSSTHDKTIDPELTIDQSGIDSGDTLYLI